MIWSAMPVEKPTMTALDTKLITAPRRSAPSTSITRPTMIVSVATLAGSVGSRPADASTLCDVSAMALVSVVIMRTVRVVSEPTIAGTMPA